MLTIFFIVGEQNIKIGSICGVFFMSLQPFLLLFSFIDNVC